MPGRSADYRRPWIEHIWFSGTRWYEAPLWLLLAPAALIYAAMHAARDSFWRIMRRRADVRTISVGNLTVGGNSKTPFTLFLASRLQARGLRVGIVSRGFGRRRIRRERAALVSDGREIKLGPDEAGDEPVMMAKAFAGPIAVARRRLDGIRMLQEAFELEIVILDDAFQHARLARDVDLVLVNWERGVGNGWRLPAGPMREKLGAIKRASAAIIVSSRAAPSALTDRQMKRLSEVPILRASIVPRALVRSEQGKWVEEPIAMAGRRVLAVSGLADPGGFYAILREIEADLIGVLEYPDHHNYTSADWQTILSFAPEADMVLTTEKDLAKLEKFPFRRNSLYALRVEVVMSAEDAARLDEIALGAGAPESARSFTAS